MNQHLSLRSGNPTLNAKTFSGFDMTASQSMTISGTVQKTGFLSFAFDGSRTVHMEPFCWRSTRWWTDDGGYDRWFCSGIDNHF